MFNRKLALAWKTVDEMTMGERRSICIAEEEDDSFVVTDTRILHFNPKTGEVSLSGKRDGVEVSYDILLSQITLINTAAEAVLEQR